MDSPSAAFVWLCFENIPAGPEAAALAASCAFSLATLEVASFPKSAGFALTERKEPAVWRWAIVGECGFLIEEGFQPSQRDAKRAAEGALKLTRQLADRALAI